MQLYQMIDKDGSCDIDVAPIEMARQPSAERRAPRGTLGSEDLRTLLNLSMKFNSIG